MKMDELYRNLLFVGLSLLIYWVMMFFHFYFLIWFVFVPYYFVLLFELRKNNPSLGRIFVLSCLFGCLIPVVGFFWFIKYSLVFLLLSVVLIGASFVIQAIFIYYLPLKKTLYRAIVLPVLWLVLMFFYSFHELGASWMNVAFYQPMSAPLIWVLGSIGVTFLIFLFNTLVACYFVERDFRLLYVAIFIGVVFVLCFFYSSFDIVGENSLKVALVQGAYDVSWEDRFDNSAMILNRYDTLSRTAALESPDLIVWPEYSIPADVLRNETQLNQLSRIAKDSGAYLVVGALYFLDSNHTLYYDNRTDIALVFSPDGEMVWKYESTTPVPFDSEVSPGTGSPNFEGEDFSFTLALCFEEYLGNSAIDGSNSDFFLTISNNQRFDSTSGIELVSLFSRLRASENGKYLVRSTNTGKTMIVSPRGKVVESLPLSKEGILVSEIYF